jgi:glycopeptide antibiotics resistance protein
VRWFGALAMLATFVAALVVTLWPFAFSLDPSSIARKWSRVEWVLFYRHRGQITIDRDLLLNLAMLLPLGAGFALARTTRGLRLFLEALLLGVAAALVLEAGQLLTPHRVTQLADVWRNALGCGLGALLGLGIRRRFAPRSRVR